VTVEHVTVEEAAARFPALLASVLDGGARVVIEKDGEEVAALVGAPELQKLPEEPLPSWERKGALALVGLWADVPEEEIDAFLKDIYESRAADLGRPVDFSDLIDY
jgi:antitoxin (DNA-binding transcriptional repressor) of toxin-antitoxin stability system